MTTDSNDDDHRKKNKGGRPKKSNPRKDQVVVRLTADERLRLEELAGETHLSEYMRAATFKRAARIPPKIPELNREAWSDLSRVASNLNQLAHRANSGEVVASDELQSAIQNCRKLLADVRTLLLKGESEDGDR